MCSFNSHNCPFSNPEVQKFGLEFEIFFLENYRWTKNTVGVRSASFKGANFPNLEEFLRQNFTNNFYLIRVRKLNNEI